MGYLCLPCDIVNVYFVGRVEVWFCCGNVFVVGWGCDLDVLCFSGYAVCLVPWRVSWFLLYCG